MLCELLGRYLRSAILYAIPAWAMDGLSLLVPSLPSAADLGWSQAPILRSTLSRSPDLRSFFDEETSPEEELRHRDDHVLPGRGQELQ